jgi:hypothetical protein
MELTMHHHHHEDLRARRVSDFSRDELESLMQRGRQLRARALRDALASLLGRRHRRPSGAGRPPRAAVPAG